jgi:flagellar motility protein MotE (MotC chaperone)
MTNFTRFKQFSAVMPATVLAIALLLGLKVANVAQALMPGRSSGSPMLASAQAAPAPTPLAEPASPPTPVPPPMQSEPAISSAERQLLQDLRNRRTELDAREHVLQQRESVMDAAEHRLTGRIAEMAALQARLEQLETARRDHDDANWAGLVKVYETMKPREAAAIFNEMEMPVLLQVIDRMKDAKAASILGAMQPDRARMVTAQLAAQRVHSTTVPDHAG